MKKIDSITDPNIAPFSSLKQQDSLFIVEGKKCVESLFKSSLEVLSVLIYEKYLPLIPKGIEVYIADESIMTQIVGYKMHQGIMALAKIPAPLLVENLVGNTVVIQGLSNAENVGAILRNCAAFGIHNVIYDSKCSPPYLRRSVKTCMGSIFSMNLYKSDHLKSDLIRLSKRGYQIIGADPKEENLNIKDLAITQPFVVVIGSEGHGLDEEIKQICQLVKIKIEPQVDSINAAAASAIFFYQISK
ncbi:MAG: RNA methyltransferase [Rhabdochlamydiaceae bacterium]|nr:RNA methyltransferase [Candidatus Amphrikana amoebophyrae]